MILKTDDLNSFNLLRGAVECLRFELFWPSWLWDPVSEGWECSCRQLLDRRVICSFRLPWRWFCSLNCFWQSESLQTLTFDVFVFEWAFAIRNWLEPNHRQGSLKEQITRRSSNCRQEHSHPSETGSQSQEGQKSSKRKHSTAPRNKLKLLRSSVFNIIQRESQEARESSRRKQATLNGKIKS
jgi:hypothetical protein